MATAKRRLNITLSSEVSALLSTLAKRDQIPEATKASQLLSTSLMLEEDKAFSLIADERMNGHIKWISSPDMWGN